jgi:hypothetical protein
MILDCYDFYLWSTGNLRLSEKRIAELTNYFVEEEIYE